MYITSHYYDAGLLKKYGFDKPPVTWAELEQMARIIQAGERAKGRKDFWGYVWAGSANEGLTTTAMEWQYSMGGGRFIEPDHRISVNNSQTIRALEMARSWIGSISPPTVVSYQNSDAMNLWLKGNSAFARCWSYRIVSPTGLPADRKFGVALPPGGTNGPVYSISGISLGISKYSSHQKEAVELLRYLISVQAQMERGIHDNAYSSYPSLYSDPEYSRDIPQLALIKQAIDRGGLAKPVREAKDK